MKKELIVTALVVVSSSTLYAQTGYELTPVIGVNAPKNDVNIDEGFIGGLMLQANMSMPIDPRVAVTHTERKDGVTMTRATLDGVVELTDNQRLVPYLMAGVGYQYSDSTSSLKIDDDDGFANAGIGLKYALNDTYNIGMELKQLVTFDESDQHTVATLGVGVKFGHQNRPYQQNSAQQVHYHTPKMQQHIGYAQSFENRLGYKQQVASRVNKQTSTTTQQVVYQKPYRYDNYSSSFMQRLGHKQTYTTSVEEPLMTEPTASGGVIPQQQTRSVSTHNVVPQYNHYSTSYEQRLHRYNHSTNHQATMPEVKHEVAIIKQPKKASVGVEYETVSLNLGDFKETENYRSQYDTPRAQMTTSAQQPANISYEASSNNDNDSDGVNDRNDRCPGSKHGLAVNSYGCSLFQLYAAKK
jgi:hypothetical protein